MQLLQFQLQIFSDTNSLAKHPCIQALALKQVVRRSPKACGYLTCQLLLAGVVALGAGCGSPESASNAGGIDTETHTASEMQQAAQVVAQEKEIADIAAWTDQANQLESQFRFVEAAQVWKKITEAVEQQAGKDSWQATNARLSLETAKAEAEFNDQELMRLREFIERRTLLEKHLRNREMQAAIEDMMWMVGSAELLLGRDSHTVGRLRLSLGQLLVQLGQQEDAHKYLESALKINEMRLGANHPETETNFFQLGQSNLRQGNHLQGIALLNRALASSKSLWGEEHTVTASRHNDLGVAYHLAGQLKMAEQQLRRALEIRQDLLKSNDPTIGESLRNLGVVFLDANRLEDSKKALDEAVDILSGSSGDENLLTIDSRTRLATVNMLEKNYPEAEGQLRLVVHQLENNSDNSRGLAKACFQLAVALGHQKQYEEAEPLLKKAISIQRTSLGQWHPETVQSLRTLAHLYDRTGETEQAKTINDSLGRLKQQ